MKQKRLWIVLMLSILYRMISCLIHGLNASSLGYLVALLRLLALDDEAVKLAKSSSFPDPVL